MLKFNRNTNRVFGVVSSLLLFGFVSPSTHAETEPVDIFCVRTGAEFKTQMRYSDRSQKTVLVWNSYIEGKSPEERCREASRQFSINYENGLKYSAVGQALSGKPVICAVKIPTSDLVKCSQSNILFHLDKNDDGSHIQRMLEESIRPESSLAVVTGYEKPIGADNLRSKEN
jgi:Circadian oscillating protein COP23